MINFLGRYIPNLAHRAEPLHNLLKRDVLWSWSDAQQRAFEDLKQEVSKQTILTIFDQDSHIIIECDASDYGLGAALYQNGRPVAFGSRTLTPTERGYAQIEKEMLAVVFALEKFHHYVFGVKVVVYSDHKPLQSIVQKPLFKAPKRLQTLLMRARNYDFDLQYRPGGDQVVADALSRAPLSAGSPREPSRDIDQVWSVHVLPVSDGYLPILQQHTQMDPTLQVVLEHIQRGWPASNEGLSPDVNRFFYHRDELAVSNGVIVRGDRVVIPLSLRADMKKKIHAGHQGINASLRRARELVFWPGMSGEIRQYVEACGACNAAAPAQPPETLAMHETPQAPWLKVGTDIFVLQGRSYLVLVDYFSKFIEVDFLQDTLASTVITKLKHHFARHGIPQEVVSDGGPQYRANDFTLFAKQWGFRHVFSSPGNSQSNGQAEAAVKTVKSLMRKCLMTKEDPYLGLLALRNTPTETGGSSPSKRLFGRATRTSLPTTLSQLRFELPEITKTCRRLEEQKGQIASRNSVGHRDLPALQQGQRIWHRDPHAGGKPLWTPVEVIVRASPRSYDILTERGSCLRRNRRFLKPRTEGSEQATPHACDISPERGSGPRRNHSVMVPRAADSKGPSNLTGVLPESPAVGVSVTPSEETRDLVITRTGREIRPPKRLDL